MTMIKLGQWWRRKSDQVEAQITSKFADGSATIILTGRDGTKFELAPVSLRLYWKEIPA